MAAFTSRVAALKVNMDSIRRVHPAARVDSVFNGADDDASGTTGVIELAEAFSRPGARPKRSIIFLTVSGEEKGLWGSRYFTQHPPVPIGRIASFHSAVARCS